MAYTEEVAFVPGSTNDPAHASHRPAPSLTAGTRSAQSDALADAALAAARATLAAHKPLASKLPFWF